MWTLGLSELRIHVYLVSTSARTYSLAEREAGDLFEITSLANTNMFVEQGGAAEAGVRRADCDWARVVRVATVGPNWPVPASGLSRPLAIPFVTATGNDAGPST